MMSQPVTPIGNAGRERQISATPGATGRRLPLPCKPTNVSPAFVPHPGRRQQPAQTRNNKQLSEWMSMSTQSHKSSTRSGKGQRKPPSITKANEPTRSRQLQEPTNSRKKCLANPLRESASTNRDEMEEHQRTDQLPVAATTDRTPPTQATAITHQDARNHVATTQSNTPDKKASTTHDHSHGRRPLVTRAMQSLPF